MSQRVDSILGTSVVSVLFEFLSARLPDHHSPPPSFLPWMQRLSVNVPGDKQLTLFPHTEDLGLEIMQVPLGTKYLPKELSTKCLLKIAKDSNVHNKRWNELILALISSTINE